MDTQLASTALDKTIANPDNSLSSFGADAAYHVLPCLIFEGFIGMQQELIVMASDPVTLQLERVSTPTLGADLRIPVLDLHPFTVQLWAGGSLLAPQSTASYSMELGEGYGGGLSLGERISSHWDLYGEGSLNEYRQPTTLTSQSSEEMLLSLGLRYRIGEGVE